MPRFAVTLSHVSQYCIVVDAPTPDLAVVTALAEFALREPAEPDHTFMEDDPHVERLEPIAETGL